MANIMDMVKLHNKPSRNGFDLSFKNNFTAKAGELLPVMCKPVIPADRFRINLSSFTRLQPLNSSAFARMREYYDFYFVPMDILWNKFNTAVTQMTENLQRSSGPYLSDNVALSGELPYITCEQLATYIQYLSVSSGNFTFNLFGFKRAYLTCKLLEYLGYGSFYAYLEPGVTWATNPMPYNLEFSVFPLLAYQHIYADHFRYSQWEKTNPSTFNVDYVRGAGSSLNLDLSNAKFTEHLNFLDLRYANFHKDLFFGVQPNAQFGDEVQVPVSGIGAGIGFSRIAYNSGLPVVRGAMKSGPVNFSDTTYGNTSVLTDSEGNQAAAGYYNHSSGEYSNLVGQQIAQMSILQLRRQESYQRWKEIAQSVDQDYASYISSQFGISVSQYLSDQSLYLNGTATSLDINPVVNQNITGNNGAEIAGLGTFSNQGYVEFDAQGRYGYLMCIYHVVPVFDYASGSVDSCVTDTHVLDFPIPVMDSIGMEQVPSYLMSNIPPVGANNQQMAEFVTSNKFLGYAPRYVKWKTSVDVARGAFTSSLKSWVMPFDADVFARLRDFASSEDLETSESISSDRSLMWTFFKVNPHVVDSLFAVAVDQTNDTDNFLCSSYFDIKVVRPLDVDGLPY